MNSNTDCFQAAAPAPESSGERDTMPQERHQPHQSPGDHNAHPPRVGLLLIVIVIAAVGAFAAGWFPRQRDKAQVETDAKTLALPTVAVTSPVQAKAAPALTLSGELRPVAEAALYARANGFVRSWTADLGAHVEKDQVLAELDTPELKRQLAQGVAELTLAHAARDLAEKTADRWREMLTSKAVSKQEADEKVADLELKKATVEAAAENVHRLEDLLNYNKITAPFAGTITVRNLDVGQLVTEGAGRELYRIAQLNKLRLFVRVPQSYARAVTVGQSTELTVPELPGRKYTGQVVRTAGAFDVASRTLLTEIEVDNTNRELLAGSFALVRLADAHPEAALTLPSGTILFRPEGPMVAVVKDNKIDLRPITLGRDFGATMEILAGVTPLDHVVLSPPDSVVNGMDVRVVEPKKDIPSEPKKEATAPAEPKK